MSNMSYCRFENTFGDLDDCYEYLFDNNLSNREKMYRDRLVKLCKQIASEYEEEDEE